MPFYDDNFPLVSVYEGNISQGSVISVVNMIAFMHGANNVHESMPESAVYDHIDFCYTSR